jgi:hypothetical protein
LPLKGFTAQGAPIYDFADLQVVVRPSEFVEVLRARYYPATDTMYVSGYTWDHQVHHHQWVGAGPEVIRYDHWSTPQRAVTSRIVFPGRGTSISSMEAVPSRDLLFAVEVETETVFCYDSKSGRLLGIVEPDPDVVGQVGWVDFPGGGLHAVARANGEIWLTVQESYTRKEVVYRLPAGFEKGLQR